MSISQRDRASADKTIGSALRDLRERSGITQEQVAQQLHCSQTIISAVESGNRSVKLVEAILFSYGVGMPPQELYEQVRDALDDKGLLPPRIVALHPDDAERDMPRC